MVGVILLILYGLILIFFGAKIFWAFFFISLGLYIFYTYYKTFKRTKAQKKILEKSIINIIKENDPEEAAKIISRKIEYPIGTKFVIRVNSEDEKVNLVFPLGVLIATKPLLHAMKPMMKKYMKYNSEEESGGINFDFDPIFDVIIESIDYFADFYGDFIDVETDGGKTKVKIYVA